MQPARESYKVLVTEDFLKKLKKATSQEQKRIRKIIMQLKSNPHSGKPLGFEFFREKKLSNKRIYYLIYEIKLIVLVVTYGGKKNQQATIDAIKSLLKQYSEEIAKDELNYFHSFTRPAFTSSNPFAILFNSLVSTFSSCFRRRYSDFEIVIVAGLSIKSMYLERKFYKKVLIRNYTAKRGG